MAHLASDAVIVKDPDFERAYVLALSGRIEELTGDQQLMLDPFEMTRSCHPDSRLASSELCRQSTGGHKEAKNSEEGALHTPPSTQWNAFLAWRRYTLTPPSTHAADSLETVLFSEDEPAL
ncbi:hypothetical protein GQ600_24811 [Phytophthora cactorum]|nr:hypothetical protein GQ600_24811 [Phytophthora cactorum]